MTPAWVHTPVAVLAQVDRVDIGTAIVASESDSEDYYSARQNK
jgi:hypothetical protein